jgi:hypothetical protein
MSQKRKRMFTIILAVILAAAVALPPILILFA